MIRTRHLLAAALALALTACASQPARYYTLIPPVQAGQPALAAPFQFELLPVGIPAQVDQPSLVIRQGGQGAVPLGGERWIAPLADEVRGALAADLVRALPGRDVGGMAAGGKPLLQVSLDVRRFDSQPGDHALLEGAWRVRWNHDGKLATQACSSRIRETVGPGYDALVQGHQQALGKLAGEVAEVARALASGQPARCPEG